jgi:hypothetical protein
MSYASPNITFQDWSSKKKSDIDIVEDQLEGWLFEQAASLSLGQHAGPAILTLVTPYFEAIACYLSGKSSRGKETQFLRQGLVAVFPSIPVIAIDRYINEVRHGVTHEAVFRKVAIHRGGKDLLPFGLEANDLLYIDPWWLLSQAKSHFANYIATLRSGSDDMQLANFKAFMEIRKNR